MPLCTFPTKLRLWIVIWCSVQTFFSTPAWRRWVSILPNSWCGWTPIFGPKSEQCAFGLRYSLLAENKRRFRRCFESMPFTTHVNDSVCVICTCLTGLWTFEHIDLTCLQTHRIASYNECMYRLCKDYNTGWREKNQCIRQKTGAQNIVKEIKQYQEKWVQHVQRMNTNILPKQALQYKPKGRRITGRPRKRWRDQLHLENQGTGNMPNPAGTWRWRKIYAKKLLVSISTH